MTVHPGSCHCGAVVFRIDAEIVELTTCDCSLCVKKNALMTRVPESALTIVKGEDSLTLYQWNTKRAKHYFRRHCGIYVFHRKRSQPDHFGVNVFCLDGFDHTNVPVRATEGRGMSVEAAEPRAEWPGPRE
ncbi:MAG: GFA family protein [Reyranellaceae bacterium]